MTNQPGPQNSGNEQERLAALDYLRQHFVLMGDGRLGFTTGGPDSPEVTELAEGHVSYLEFVFNRSPEEARAYFAELYRDFLGTESGIYSHEKLTQAALGVQSVPDSIMLNVAQSFADATHSAKPYPDAVVRAVNALTGFDALTKDVTPDTSAIDQAEKENPEELRAALATVIGTQLDRDGDGKIFAQTLLEARESLPMAEDLASMDTAFRESDLALLNRVFDDIASGTSGFTVTGNIAPSFAQAAEGNWEPVETPTLVQGAEEGNWEPVETSILNSVEELTGVSPEALLSEVPDNLAALDTDSLMAELEILPVEIPGLSERQDSAPQMGAAPVQVLPLEIQEPEEPIVYTKPNAEDPLAPDEVTSEDPANDENTYTVQKGDVLSMIAQCAYDCRGQDEIQRTTEALAQFNNIPVEKIHDLEVGQVLVIPPRDVMDAAIEGRVIAGDWTQRESKYAATCGLCEFPRTADTGTSDVTVANKM